MFVVMVALVPCKSYCKFVIHLIQNGTVYVAVELPRTQIVTSQQDLLDLYFDDLF